MHMPCIPKLVTSKFNDFTLYHVGAHETIDSLCNLMEREGKGVYSFMNLYLIFRQIMECAAECNPILGQLCVYVAQDCTSK